MEFELLRWGHDGQIRLAFTDRTGSDQGGDRVFLLRDDGQVLEEIEQPEDGDPILLPVDLAAQLRAMLAAFEATA